MEVVHTAAGGHKVNFNMYSISLNTPSSEANDANATECIAQTAADLALQKISLDMYLDRMLAHLRKDGPRHLPWDEPPRDWWPEQDLAPYHMVDIVGGVVKGIMWEEGFEALDHDDWSILRTLAKVVWTSPTVEEFTSQTTSSSSTPLTSLPPTARDILLAIAYARRHTPLFLHLVSTLPPPRTPCFSLFDRSIIDRRTNDCPPRTYQHSAMHPSNVETEARYWAAIIKNGWIGTPEDQTLENELMRLAHRVTIPGGPGPQWRQEWGIDASSLVLDELQAQLQARGHIPDLAAVGDFVSNCPDMARARQYFARFPGPEIAPSPGIYPAATAQLLVLLIESKNYDDAANPSLRTDMVRLVLETIPGLDVNAHVQRPNREMIAYGMPESPGDDFTALHAAAWRGDLGIGRLLVEHGARMREKEKVRGLRPAEVARERGFIEFAQWAEGVGAE